MRTKYLKAFKKRGQKITSLNLEFYQYDFIKSKGLKVSVMARDLIDEFLKESYGQEYLRAKHDYLKENE